MDWDLLLLLLRRSSVGRDGGVRSRSRRGTGKDRLLLKHGVDGERVASLLLLLAVVRSVGGRYGREVGGGRGGRREGGLTSERLRLLSLRGLEEVRVVVRVGVGEERRRRSVRVRVRSGRREVGWRNERSSHRSSWLSSESVGHLTWVGRDSVVERSWSSWSSWAERKRGRRTTAVVEVCHSRRLNDGEASERRLRMRSKGRVSVELLLLLLVREKRRRRTVEVGREERISVEIGRRRSGREVGRVRRLVRIGSYHVELLSDVRGGLVIDGLLLIIHG